ncbi:hypothetical protein H671_2g7165 [Cricetulus griseus]|nr:hypothetical protein H671_2g7165 [Cricetulus griseus]
MVQLLQLEQLNTKKQIATNPGFDAFLEALESERQNAKSTREIIYRGTCCEKLDSIYEYSQIISTHECHELQCE